MSPPASPPVDGEDEVDDDESPPWPPRRSTSRRLPIPLRAAAIVLALAAGALLAAGLWRAAPARDLVVPTAVRTAAPSSSIDGVVTAVRTGGRVCFSAATRSGRVFVVAPRGWTADADLRLLDRLGRVRLIAGTRARLIGSPGEADHVAGCPGVGRPWYTTDLRAVG